jgi:hypothetical protein
MKLLVRWALISFGLCILLADLAVERIDARSKKDSK